MSYDISPEQGETKKGGFFSLVYRLSMVDQYVIRHESAHMGDDVARLFHMLDILCIYRIYFASFRNNLRN